MREKRFRNVISNKPSTNRMLVVNDATRQLKKRLHYTEICLIFINRMFMKKESGRENMRETKRDREIGAECMN